MLSRQNKHLLLKVVSLFSVIRGYNILIIVLAQYLTSVFILAPDLSLGQVIFDGELFALILSSALVIASGYIINNFYDSEKDLINRPNKTMLDRLVSQQTKLNVYFILNIVAVLIASYVSFRATLFFSIYIFGIWIYSHRLSKIAFVGNFTSAILAIVPFFAVFVYYRNFELVIFVHALFLFLIISMREMVKDLENLKGDIALGYQTIPVVFGTATSKWLVTGLLLLAVVPTYLLIARFEIGLMNYYFYLCAVLLGVFLFILWQSKAKLHYLTLHNILKAIIVLGVFCIPLIDPSVVIEQLP
ncbi:geranylgeranylglycerol-phosphate geranylgeranyltransferase [Gangjinia marincola]|uniref:Geranylgeranylglycerol-phosphate geranylgeranyltransferase n=1 Tax=Gangjinia marincola TaxID=578463 RepID=A0ABP3XVW8_9FLAO